MSNAFELFVGRKTILIFGWLNNRNYSRYEVFFENIKLHF
jgi:hypothetical protein